MKRVVYKDENGKVFFDQTYFSPEEIKDAAICIFSKRPSEFDSVQDIYEHLRYFLGAHYWSTDYEWKRVA